MAEADAAIKDLLRMNLAAAGYACTCALDGEPVANLIEQNSFDLALLDIMLPMAPQELVSIYIPNEHDLRHR